MRKKSAALFLLSLTLISSACSGSPLPTNSPPASVSPTNTKPAEATPTERLPDPYSGSGDGYSSPAEVPDPGTAHTDVVRLPNQAYFQDRLATADTLVVEIDNVEPAPANQIYQGWIRNEDGSLINAGVLEVQESRGIHLEWTAPDGRNLIASVTGFLVNLEDAPGSSQFSGKVVYAGEMPSEQIALARSLFVSNTAEPVTPRNKAFATALVQQTNLAIEHVKNAINAEAIGATKERTLHLEHVINIIEGSKGERFKDYDGDGSAENPGDGFGVMAYAGQVAAKLNQESITAKAQEVLVALLSIEQEAIAILEEQNDAIALSELKAHFDDVNMNLVIVLYNMSEQAVAFKIEPISAP